MIKVQRYFLELKLSNIKIQTSDLMEKKDIKLENVKNFQINKFFYKLIGADHYWRDRLIWSDLDWEKYISNKNLQTWILKANNNLVGYYEVEYHQKENEIELINMGVVKEFRGKKYGSILLNHAIKKTFEKKFSRIWVHTCSLDHKHALYNYKSKGLKVFKEEQVDYVA
jgi:ribosomal protein S18 acetylase RimI-like enzyme